MFVLSTRRAFTTGAALLFLAGCSAGASTSAPGLQTAVAGLSNRAAPAGYRWVPGPALAGPQLSSIAHRGVASSGPNKTAPTLFVADVGNNVVELYDAKTKNPTPIGSISAGIDAPIGLAVDKHGTLYVASISDATVTEYLAGQTFPNFTITSGMSSPYGIGVNSKGDVFVSNLGTSTVSAYKPNQNSPYATIGNVGPNPVGVAVDGNDNVYICDDSDNTIYVVPAGSTTAQNSGLTGLTGPIGMSFTTGDTAYVSNFGANNVSVYPSGATAPSTVITSGINGPTLNGFAKSGTFFQTNQGVDVVAYKKGKTSPYSSISGLGSPAGIASFPAPKL